MHVKLLTSGCFFYQLLVLVLVGAVCAVTEEENPVLPGLAVRAETTFLFSSTVTVSLLSVYSFS